MCEEVSRALEESSQMQSRGRGTRRVAVFLLAGMLVSCGGGGNSTSSSGGGDSTGSSGDSVGTPPSAGAHIEESNAAVSFSAADWTQSDPNFGWSGGAAKQSTVLGAKAAFTFTGTSVRWIGNRAKTHVSGSGQVAHIARSGASTQATLPAQNNVREIGRSGASRTPVRGASRCLPCQSWRIQQSAT